jgi:antitoxin component of MazEF toxin-antitoxin module
MTSLAISSKGQVTLKRDLLQHMGIKPGEKIEVERLPGNELRLRAERRKGSITDIFGLLAGQSPVVATIEEINEAIAKGWAGQLEMPDE